MAKKAPTLDANGYRKFGIRDSIAYAAGDLGCNMSFSLKGTVQTFWLVFPMSISSYSPIRTLMVGEESSIYIPPLLLIPLRSSQLWSMNSDIVLEDWRTNISIPTLQVHCIPTTLSHGNQTFLL